MKQNMTEQNFHEAPNIPVIFGNNLRKYRKQQGFTQEQLSEKLGITQKHLSIIETGTQFVSAGLLGKIVVVLKIPPAALFEYEISYNTTEIYESLCSYIDNRFDDYYKRIKNDINSAAANNKNKVER